MKGSSKIVAAGLLALALFGTAMAKDLACDYGSSKKGKDDCDQKLVKGDTLKVTCHDKQTLVPSEANKVCKTQLSKLSDSCTTAEVISTLVDGATMKSEDKVFTFSHNKDIKEDTKAYFVCADSEKDNGTVVKMTFAKDDGSSASAVSFLPAVLISALVSLNLLA